MIILQIANDFCRTKVHMNLFKRLDDKGVEQVIYNPVRNEEYIGRNSFDGKSTKIVYSHVVKPFHRYVYHIKRRTVFKDLLSKVNVNSINLSYASTLMTDGGLAYLLYKKYHIPYIVAVRNTDINGFMELAPHTWWDCIHILLHAERIFFISEGLKQKFESHFIVRLILERIKGKFVLMPNGIDDYFLNNISTGVCKEHKVMYVGDFSNNKNVVRLCKAILRLRQQKGFEDTVLTIVGGGKNETDEVEKMIVANPEAFNYVGKVYEKDKLCSIFRSNSIFAMPSIHETFGLVYLEALSQNLPVLYTKGQGIDGLFADTVGIGVNPLSEYEIYAALKEMLFNRDRYYNKDVDFSAFRWDNIADKYIEHYKDCLGIAGVNRSLLGGFKKAEKVKKNS